MKKDISIITIANNIEIYEEFLRNLHEQVNINYELITIDNYNNNYLSATRAYNLATKNAKGNYLFFLHPDIRFQDNTELSKILKILNLIEDFDVVGIAGAVGKGSKRIIKSNIIHGSSKRSVGQKIDGPTKVQTVDECMFIIKKDKFNKNFFKERDGWHLYAVEYCLEAIKNNGSVYVIPSNIWHLSDGKSLDYHYMFILNDIINDYKKYFKVIYTTVKGWKTRGVFSKIYRNYYFLKQWLKGKIIKR